MIELHLLIRLPRRQKRSLLDAFKCLAKWARAEQGCVSAELFLAAAEPCCLRYVEAWKSEDDLRQMIRSQRFSRLIALMELASEAPECEFRVIRETRGLEFVAQVRDCPDARSASSADAPAGNRESRFSVTQPITIVTSQKGEKR